MEHDGSRPEAMYGSWPCCCRSKNEEKHLLEHDLVFGPGDGWLRALFGSRLCLQDPEQVLKDKFRTLEEVSSHRHCWPCCCVAWHQGLTWTLMLLLFLLG